MYPSLHHSKTLIHRVSYAIIILIFGLFSSCKVYDLDPPDPAPEPDPLSLSLVEFQGIETNGAWDLEYFTIEGDHFLAVANYYNGSYTINSKIYKWTGGKLL